MSSIINCGRCGQQIFRPPNTPVESLFCTCMLAEDLDRDRSNDDMNEEDMATSRGRRATTWNVLMFSVDAPPRKVHKQSDDYRMVAFQNCPSIDEVKAAFDVKGFKVYRFRGTILSEAATVAPGDDYTDIDEELFTTSNKRLYCQEIEVVEEEKPLIATCELVFIFNKSPATRPNRNSPVFSAMWDESRIQEFTQTSTFTLAHWTRLCEERLIWGQTS
eukprot:TRINITY_DN16265_c0_g1_i1.p1 TRINITY_DN16265_c0_g1~~TRINITY_DN16265_c0_g1_i1.p1  ORF type:complete len:218 (+),score=39.14 TRINITY_DN16265_c0_g1_i1:355-1008(+)